MKKGLYTCIIFFLILSWCSTKTDTFFDVSFEQAENIISENVNFLLQETKWTTMFQNYWADCKISSDNNSIYLDTNIITTWYFNQNKDERFDINPDIHFLDKKWKKELLTSWSIENIYLDWKYFIRLSGMSVDMWKWNYESNLWFMIIENLRDKRINYKSDKFDNIKNTQKNISFILNTLSSSSVFENIEQVTYEWNLAYKVVLKPNIVDFIKDQTNIEISKFEWLFIVSDENQVDLKINNMEIKDVFHDNIAINIKWILWWENGEIIYSMEWENTSIAYDVHRKYTNINIKKDINYDKIWNLNLIVYPSQKKEISKYDLKWNLSISPIFIYWSDLENDLKIDIKCLYENFSWEILEIQEPDNYILLEQILWDEFSIKNFIWDK